VEGVRRSSVVRHVILSVAMWLVYVLYWRIVLSRGVEREARLAFLLLGVFVVLQVLVTAAWVAHNRSVAARHRSRRRERSRASAEEPLDCLGHRLRTLPEGGDLRTVPVVIVRIEGEEKRFEAGFLFGADPERGP
jgi:heme A synthase